MSEALAADDTIRDELVARVLALQQAILPELRKDGGDRLKRPTFGSLGVHVLKQVIGRGEVEVRATLLTEPETEKSAMVLVRKGKSERYIIWVNDGILSRVNDEAGEQVEDEAILRMLKKKILQSHLVYSALHLKNSLGRWYNNPNDTASNQ